MFLFLHVPCSFCYSIIGIWEVFITDAMIDFIEAADMDYIVFSFFGWGFLWSLLAEGIVCAVYQHTYVLSFTHTFFLVEIEHFGEEFLIKLLQIPR